MARSRQQKPVRKVWTVADYGNLEAAQEANRVKAGKPAPGTVAPGFVGRDVPSSLPSGVSTIGGAVAGTPIKPSAEVQAQAQALVANPKQYAAQAKTQIAEDQSLTDQAKSLALAPINAGASLLSRIFDTSDTPLGEQSDTGPTETIFDNMLNGLNWGYNKKSQILSWGISALPGGIDTFTSEQADKIGMGQAGQANIGALTAPLIAKGTSAIFNMLPNPEAAQESFDSNMKNNMLFMTPDFQVTNDAQRKVAFEDQLAGKLMSGTGGAVLETITDPLILGGKALKVARLAVIDVPLNTVAGKQRFWGEIDKGVAQVISGDTEKLHPAIQHLNDAITPRADGSRMSPREVLKRVEIGESSDAAGYADAITSVKNGDIETAALVLKAHTGDPHAYTALMERNATAAQALADARRETFELAIKSNPDRYQRAITILTGKSDRAWMNLQQGKRAHAAGRLSDEALAGLEKDFNRSVDELTDMQDGLLKDPIASADMPEAWAMQKKLVEERMQDARIAEHLATPTTWSSLEGADRTFSRNNALGRAVGNRRARAATAAYQQQATSKAGWESKDFFGNGIVRQATRVWRWFGNENPSYYAMTNGTGEVGTHREVGAFVDSLKMYAGTGKEVIDPITGTKRIVGGVAAKEAMFKKYLSARADSSDATAALTAIEKQIQEDMVVYYELNKDTADHIINEIFAKRTEYADQINRTGAFYAKENPKLNIAPFLKTQLAQGHYFLPWDKLEKAFDNILSGKIKDPRAEGILTRGQATQEHIGDALNLFQDFWRPAVLFRLGYTQRNVTEGMFRSAAYLNSLAPIGWGFDAATRQAARNFRRASRAAKQVEKAEKLLAEPVVGREHFDRLVTQQGTLQEHRRMLMGMRGDVVESEAARAKWLADEQRIPAREWQAVNDGEFLSNDGLRVVRQTGEDIRDGAWSKDESGAYIFTSGDLHVTVGKKGSRWAAWDANGEEIAVGRTLKAVKAEVESGAPAKGRKPDTWDAIDGDGVIVRAGFSNRVEAMAAHAPAGERPSYIPEFRSDGSGYMSTDGTWQIVPVDDGKWAIREQVGSLSEARYAMSPSRYESAEQAANSLNKAIDDAAKGRIDPSGSPNLMVIAKERQALSDKATREFKDSRGGIHQTAKSVDDAIEEINQQLDEVQDKISKFKGRPSNPALLTTKFGKWRQRQIEAADTQALETEAWIKMFRELHDGMEVSPQHELNLRWMEDQADRIRTQAIDLEMDDLYALEQYRSQATAKRWANSGDPVEFSPGVIIHDAFTNPRYRDIAAMNLSANNTQKATLSMRMNMMESVWLRKKVEQYVDVTPADGKRYWEGMEQMLQQFSQDEVGKRLAAGASHGDVAIWLMRDPEGKATVRQLNAAWKAAQIERKRLPKEVLDHDEIASIPNRIDPRSLQSITEYVQEVDDGLRRLTLNDPAVLAIVAKRPPRAEQLESILGGRKNLPDVVGHRDEVIGLKKPMDMYRTMTQKGFNAIGTIPEDAVVRAPFYQQRYRQTRDEMIRTLKASYENVDDVPLELVQQIEINAHRRALKDTKDWLYTIDRRSNLGKYGEVITPFITATQNSVTALGRLTRRDPALPGMMIALWRAPTKVGWEDDQGNLIIPLPHDLIPDGVEDFFGIAGMENVSINKSSLNVIFPESGFAFVPRPTPLVQVAASELMKKGLLIGPEAPSIMVSMMGKDAADQAWSYVKDYVFGEESAISPELGSYDKVLPPIMNRLIQFMQGDASAQYAYQYGIQARTQELLWRSGQREDYPTPEELKQRTNGQYLLRMMGNLFAFTPPDYQSPLEPLIEAQKRMDKAYGLDGPMNFSNLFGNEMLILSNTESTRNVGGATASANTVRNIKEYSGLIEKVAPNVGTDLSVLGILVADDPVTAIYDQTSYRYELATKIPGTSRNWREMNAGGESLAEAQRQAGWTEYMKFTGMLDSLLQGRGLKNYRVKGAQDLVDRRKAFLDNMLNNPEYAGWAIDYESTGSSRTYSAINVIETALADDNFMKNHADDPTWVTAQEYIAKRNMVVKALKESGHGITVEANAGIADWWNTERQNMIKNSPGWQAIANRYLQGDDDPSLVGTTFAKLGD